MASISKRASGAWQNTSYGIRATATDTITTLPTTIYGDGTNATISIKGNTVQPGTPTPDSPIMPEGTGERTGNLFDATTSINGIINDNGDVISNFAYSTSDYIRIDAEFTISLLSMYTQSARIIRCGYYTGSKQHIANADSVSFKDGYKALQFSPPNGTTFIRFSFISREGYADTHIMLNTGSTALPYEPYGYKIPISSADTTTPIYLDEVQTTRKIQKLVLDGTETITEESTNVYSIPITDTVTAEAGLSTHFEYDSTVLAGQFRIEAGKAVFGYNDTLANFSAFLAAQYAAGTPVTIWYILATETTGIVNEPLMKIEDYADEVNNISIPTTDGANALSVDTTVQPSEVSVNYHGWHMGTVHERTAGQWD